MCFFIIKLFLTFLVSNVSNLKCESKIHRMRVLNISTFYTCSKSRFTQPTEKSVSSMLSSISVSEKKNLSSVFISRTVLKLCEHSWYCAWFAASSFFTAVEFWSWFATRCRSMFPSFRNNFLCPLLLSFTFSPFRKYTQKFPSIVVGFHVVYRQYDGGSFLRKSINFDHSSFLIGEYRFLFTTKFRWIISCEYAFQMLLFGMWSQKHWKEFKGVN